MSPVWEIKPQHILEYIKMLERKDTNVSHEVSKAVELKMYNGIISEVGKKK